MKEKIGIVGLGRLGDNLAKYFPAETELFVCDRDASTALNCAAKYHRSCEELEHIVGELDYIFICVPPTEVRGLLEKYADQIKKNAVVVNMATSVDSEELAKVFEGCQMEIVPLKPIAEGYALSRELKGVFITSPKALAHVEKLSYLFQDMGDIIIGKEMEVQQINETATAFALKFYHDLAEELARFSIPVEGINAAIKSVAVGTILDYPPNKYNYYIDQIKKKYFIQ